MSIIIYCSNVVLLLYCSSFIFKMLHRVVVLMSSYTLLHPTSSTQPYPSPSWSMHGSELWSLTNTELNIIERTHCKILRTIQGLPIRCPEAALRSLIGSHSISSYISQQQLAFINSIINMQASDLLELETPELKESLSPGETSLMNSASPPSNSFLVHLQQRDLETINLTAPEHSSIHHHARSMREIPTR